MDKFLKPERLDVDPNCAGASKQWKHWFKTFENFLVSNSVQESDKLKLLVNFVSSNIYECIEECTTYSSAVNALTSLFVKPTNEVYARHVLATRKQQPGQSLDEYFRVLVTLSKECNFKKVTADVYRDECIRDSFINGILSTEIKQRLLENKSLDLQTMYDQARALESARNNMLSYTNETTDRQVSAVETDESSCIASNSKAKCYFCGFDKHVRSRCPAKDQTCNRCNKKGHFARVCRYKPVASVISSSETGSNDNLPKLCTVVSASAYTKSIVSIAINGINVRALIDSGSEESFIHPNIVILAALKVNQGELKKISMASSQHSMQTKGVCYVNFKLNNHSYSGVKLSVLSNLCTDVILGQDFQARHESIVLQYGGTEPSLTICGLTTIDIEPPELFANLTQDCRPIATKSRKYSNEDKCFIGDEIKKMLEQGIIEPSISPWRAQVVVTRNNNHRKRLVIDYSATVNRFTQLDAYPLPKISDLINEIAQFRIFSTIDLKSAYHQVRIKDSDKKYTAFEANGGLYQFTRIPFGVTNGVACFQRTIDTLIKEEKLTGVFPYLDDVTICGKTQQEHDDNLNKFMSVVTRRGLTINKDKSLLSSRKISILGSVIENGEIRPDPERLKPLLELPLPKDKKALQRVQGFFSYYSQWIKNFSHKIKPLINVDSFPINKEAENAFNILKNDIKTSTIFPISDCLPFVVETDSSDTAIAATLSQEGRPVAFFSRSLRGPELAHASVEKEAKAVVEAVRHWKHFLSYKHFTLKTDQKSVSYIFSNTKLNKIKNDKIYRWKMELSCYNFEIQYRPGKENLSADALSRVGAVHGNDNSKLFEIHQNLCHPGVTRMYHFVRTKNLPYSLNDIKSIITSCKTCCECKPRFYSDNNNTLIKATQPFERLNIDFKGPLPTTNQNKYFLTVIDEYSRFPFIFPCSDISSDTVIKCLTQLFVMCGCPQYIHSDRGTSFMSDELKRFLLSRGIATSRTSCYNPGGNGQCERYNGVVWNSIKLCLNDRNLHPKFWQVVLPDALHSIRSLLCTATNSTPHERFFGYVRRSFLGDSIPSWMTNGEKVLLKKHLRQNKTDPLVEEVEIVHANPQYAHVKHVNGRESTVSIKHLAPQGVDLPKPTPDELKAQEMVLSEISDCGPENEVDTLKQRAADEPATVHQEECQITQESEMKPLRKSQRLRKPPERLSYS